MKKRDVAAVDTTLPSLSNDDIETIDTGRRSFLAKVGIRSTAFMGVVTLAGCGKSDVADTDTQTDFDLGVGADPINRKSDPVDSD